MSGLIPCTCLWVQGEGGRYVREVNDPGCPAAAFHGGQGAREDAGRVSEPPAGKDGAQGARND